MRKLSGIFLVGLCLGAIGAVVVTAGHSTAAAPRPIAVTEIAATTSAAPAPTPAPAPKTEPKPTPKAAPAEVDAAELDKVVRDGTVSAVVFDRDSGKTTVSVRPDRGYTSASVVKLLIALSVLDRGGPVADVQRMLSRSDDDLASQFWSGYGGPAIVTRWATKLGLTGTRPPADPGRWGDTRITAADVVKIYQYLLDRKVTAVLNALGNATERGSDGFRQYFGIPDAAKGQDWLVKQGWSCCRPTRTLHTTGVVGHLIVVVLSEYPAKVDYATGSRRVTEVVSKLLG
ncbi:hypothetical protein [Amycolatopsis sp. Hca4]|uniref:hypothetical protein n=1 Tax=unclassified Amycolatopsis TaxID=2618356 RepID=UPI001591ABCD|nr:hypothetical protein [Amycolatopsis sp. Hca4]QKV76816.1 hypothetical protein HUT10_25820 [Amycolatopsis sp. Hca4]